MGVLTSTWFLTVFVMIIGIGLIALAAKRLGTSDTPLHIIRDLGIACFVAGLVTIFYEQVVHLRQLSDAVGLVVGAHVPRQILDAVDRQIFKTKVIRENFELRWIVSKDPKLPDDQAIIKVRISYDLYGMETEPFDFPVVQELENQNVQNQDGTLPRFDRVTVGNKTLKDEELKAKITDGTLTLPAEKLYPWPGLENSGSKQGPPTHFIFERSEIVYVPGSYTVVLSQNTHGVKLEVEVPPDMKHKLKEWFERGGQHFEPAGDKEYSFKDFVLAGQSISVQFSRLNQTQKTGEKSVSKRFPPTRRRSATSVKPVEAKRRTSGHNIDSQYAKLGGGKYGPANRSKREHRRVSKSS